MVPACQETRRGRSERETCLKFRVMGNTHGGKNPGDPWPTIAVIPPEESTINEAAGVPPKLTLVVPVKFAPLITTLVPMPPRVGEKEFTTGTCAPTKNGTERKSIENNNFIKNPIYGLMF